MRKAAWPAALFLAAIALTNSAGVAAAQQLPPVSIFHPAHAGPSKCMDVNRANFDVIQWTCNGGNNQKFEIAKNPDGTISLHTPSIINGCVTNYQGRVGVFACQGANLQKFVYASPSVLRSISDGRCLGVENASTTDGAKVVPQSCTGAPSQRWMPEPAR